MALQYNPLKNNFTVYQDDIETTKRPVILPSLDFLYNTPVDASDWAETVTEEGIPIVPNQFITSKRTVNNPERRNPIPTDEPSASSNSSTNNDNPIKYNGSDKAVYAKNFFINKGLSSHAAAGIVGNLMAESNLDPFENTGDGGLAFGIAQWQPDRQKGLKTLATNRGTSINDFDTQLEYVWYELNTDYKKVLNELKNSQNIDEATKAFMLHYEKPKILRFEDRLKYAKSLI